MSVMGNDIRPFHRELHSARRYLNAAQGGRMGAHAAADLALQCLKEADRQREKFGQVVADLLEEVYAPLGEARRTGAAASLEKAEDALGHAIAAVHTVEPCPAEAE